MESDKSLCCNCKNCVVVRRPAVISNQYLLRIHCSKDKWRKKIGEVKYYKYFTAARRSVESCEDFEPMGEGEREYVRELRKTLPIKDEAHSYAATNNDS